MAGRVVGELRVSRMVQAALGAATASCFPQAAAAAAGGHPGLLVLGAVCGCLPDMLDDAAEALAPPPYVRIVPDPASPGACDVAAALAAAAGVARTEARPVTVRVEAPAVRKGIHLCCGLAVDPRNATFEAAFHHVAAEAGAGGPPAGEEVARRLRATSPCRILIEDSAYAFARPGRGLVIDLHPAGRDGVRVVFEPRRRCGSHSLAAAGAVALGVWAAFDGAAAVVAAASMLVHIACDHLRSDGVAWLYPVGRRRRRSVRGPGAGLLADPLRTGGASAALAGWNLCRFAAGTQAVDGGVGWRAAGLLLATAALLARGTPARLLRPRSGRRSRPVRPERPAAGGEQ